MKLEMLLDKMVWAEKNKDYISYRAQVIRMFEEKDKRIAELKNTHEALVEHHRDDHHTEGTYPTFIPEAQDDSNNN